MQPDLSETGNQAAATGNKTPQKIVEKSTKFCKIADNFFDQKTKQRKNS